MLRVDGSEYRVDYEPGESTTGLFGGNSNWRGPIWFPVNYLLIESLQKFHHYLGDDFKVECPTGSGNILTLWEVAAELSRRLTRIFLRDDDGARPVHGGESRYQRRSALARSGAVLRILPRRQRRRRRRQPSDRLDRPGGQAAPAERRMSDEARRSSTRARTVVRAILETQQLDRREWLETNGLGGFASSTVVGHEYAALSRPAGGGHQAAGGPHGAALEVRRDAGRRRASASICPRNRYPGALHPQGYRYLREFRLDPFPVFVYRSWTASSSRSRVFMVHGENTTVVEYRARRRARRCRWNCGR